MKLSKRLRKSESKRDREVEYYFSENYGGIIFTIRSNVEFDKDLYRILDAAYPFVQLGANHTFIENKILDAVRFWSKIKSAKVDVNGKECEIKLSSDPREFIGW